MESKQRNFENGNENESQKRQIKSDVNRISAAIIINTLIMIAIVVIGMVVRIFVAVRQSNASDIMTAFDEIIGSNAFFENATKSGVEYLLFSVLGILAVWLFLRKKRPLHSFLKKIGR